MLRKDWIHASRACGLLKQPDKQKLAKAFLHPEDGSSLESRHSRVQFSLEPISGMPVLRLLLIKENTLPSGTYPTQSGSARVPRVGECADKLYAGPLLIRDKNRMR
jgi:hypothetical protein